jgi:ABC-type bacteriocin/lantibiotic exporter with double-glycine peptidase domain
MNLIQIKKIVKSNIFLISLLFFLIINIVVLFVIDGPLWGFFCITLWILICFTLGYAIYWFLKKLNYRKAPMKGMLLAILILILLLTPYMSLMTHLKAEANRPELQKLAKTIISSSDTDETKTKKLLEWFNTSKNNIYNNYYLKVNGTLGFGGKIRIYLGEP